MLRIVTPTLAAALIVALAGCGSPASGAPSVAATVNGHPISLKAYHKQVAYKLYETEQTNNNVDVCKERGYGAECKQMKQDALGDLIAAELVREWAAKHGISVSKAEFQQQWAIEYKGQYHSNHLILVAFAKQLGLTPADIKNLLRENILDNKVMYRLTKNLPSVTPAVHLVRIVVSNKKELKGVRKGLKKRSFSLEAQLLNSEKTTTCSLVTCGDIGWVPEATLPADQRSLKTAPVNAIRGPFPGQTGEVLFQIAGRNKHYQLTQAQQLAWRQSIFAHWLLVQRKHAKVHRYVA